MNAIEDYEERRRIQNLLAQRKWREKRKHTSRAHLQTCNAATLANSRRDRQLIQSHSDSDLLSEVGLYHRHANALKAQQLEEVREQSLPASYCVEKSPLDRSERLPLTSPNVANANSNDNGLSVDTQPAFAFQPEWSANSGAFGYHAQVDTKEHPHMAMEIATSTFAVCPLQRLLAVEESAVDLYFPKEHFQVKIIEALDTATRFYECGKIFGVFPSDSTFLRQIDDAKILLFSLSFSDAV